MPVKRLSGEDKVQAVLDLLQGHGTHAEICTRYGLSQAYLYKLRDQSLEGVKTAVGKGGKRNLSRERQIEAEFFKAKQFIGDQALVIEVLKKSR